MEEKKQPGLEFEVSAPGLNLEPTGKADVDELMRDWFRVPVNSAERFRVNVSGREYDVINFSKSGFGIRIPKSDPWHAIGDLLPIELEYLDQVIEVEGKVICVYDDEAESRVCGLCFMDLDEEAQIKIDELYWKLRNQLFQEE